MDFDTMVARVANALNLTAPSALARIGENLNVRYRTAMAAIGMNVSARVDFPLALSPGTQEQTYDNSVQAIQIERIVALYTQSGADTRWVPLDNLTYEEMRETVPTEDVPTKWAMKRIDSQQLTFLTNSTIPDGQTVQVEAEEVTSELSSTMVPRLPAAYHEMLVMGAKADEYYKLATGNAVSAALAKKFEGSSDRPETTPDSFYGKLADLKLKMALAAYGSIRQGKHSQLSPQSPLSRLNFLLLS